MTAVKKPGVRSSWLLRRAMPLIVVIIAGAQTSCGGQISRSAEAANPPPATVPEVVPTGRPILGEPDLRLEPATCPTDVPNFLQWYVDDLGASMEYRACWTGSLVGDLVMGVLDADGLPAEAELEGRYVFSGGPTSSSLTAIGSGPSGFPYAHGDPDIAELRGLDSTGAVVAVPAIAGWADLPSMPDVEFPDGSVGEPGWTEIITLDAGGTVLQEYRQGE